jgi:hydrogenase/urease accessory protein HupE
MKTDKPFRKSLACAAVLWAVITGTLVVTGAQDLAYRFGYVLSTSLLAGIATGQACYVSKKSWSWARCAITVLMFYLLFGFLLLCGQMGKQG